MRDLVLSGQRPRTWISAQTLPTVERIPRCRDGTTVAPVDLGHRSRCAQCNPLQLERRTAPSRLKRRALTDHLRCTCDARSASRTAQVPAYA